MRSEEQKQASRDNGLRGGVKTEVGKEVSSKNAVKHGILAACLTDYDEIVADDLYSEFAKEFGDAEPSRKILIEELAMVALRLRRCRRAETELLQEILNPRVVEVRKLLEEVSWEEVVEISKGQPATVSPEALEKFAIIYERYHPRLIAQFLRILRALKP